MKTHAVGYGINLSRLKLKEGITMEVLIEVLNKKEPVIDLYLFDNSHSSDRTRYEYIFLYRGPWDLRKEELMVEKKDVENVITEILAEYIEENQIMNFAEVLFII